MKSRIVLLAALLLFWGHGGAAEIVVVYPRVPATGQPFLYEDDVDSSFIFGHIVPPHGQLSINGTTVPYSSKGAFLAFLPLRREAATKRWDLTLMDQGQALAQSSLEYVFRADLPPASPDTGVGIAFPRVIRVTDAAAHTRTAPGGSYHLFPVEGTRLLATGYRDGFFEFALASSLHGFVERRFVAVEADSALPESRLSNGQCLERGDSCICQFSITRSVPWSAEPSADGTALNVLLYGTTLAVDRLRYDGEGDCLADVTWSPRPEGTLLTLQFRHRLERGYDISFSADSLLINVRKPFAKRARRLKQKTVVVDAGHGGAAKGAIGPLGTQEKDVTLRWAQILAAELKRAGAHPVLTRTTDVDVPLPERVEIARSNHADFMVSLHVNALPEGTNPFLKHGTGTYYYQSLSQRAADILHKHMLKASGQLNDGLYDANFAVVRPTSFPAVLLEAAYVMYPPEEELLRSDKYLRKLAKGVVRGMTEYFKTQP